MKHIDLETKLGGLFGFTAIIAIIGEMYLSGFSVAGLMAGLKDISGTLVSVLVFLVAIRVFVQNSPKNIEEMLPFKWKQFESEYRPLIFKVKDYVVKKEGYYTHGFCILKDIAEYPDLLNIQKGSEKYNQYAAYRSQKTTKFLQLPKLADMIAESKTEGTFKIEMNFKDNVLYIDDLKEKIQMEIESRFQYSVSKHSDYLTIEIPQVSSLEDIERLFSMLGFAIRLFQIGNLGPK